MEQTLPLPSNGIIYPISNIVVRTMKGKDEKLLAEVNYENANEKYLALFNNLVTGIDPKKLTLGDRAYIILWERINSYSPSVNVKVICSLCGNKVTVPIDLQKIDVKELTKDVVYPVELTLTTGEKVTVRLYNTEDELKITAYEKKHSLEEVHIYKYALVLGLDNKTIEEKIAFCNELSGKDLIAIKQVNDYYLHGPDLENVKYICPSCGGEAVMLLPFRPDFLIPSGIEFA